MFFLSPLEHFQGYPLISIYFLNYDYSITNETIILFLFLILVLIYFLSFLKTSESSFYIVPNSRWQVFNELLFLGVLSIISENIKHKLGQKFFPLIFFIFIFFTINTIGFRIHGLKMFSLFIPSGTCSPLYFLIVVIEFISYFLDPLAYLFDFLLTSWQVIYLKSYFRLCICFLWEPVVFSILCTIFCY